MVLLLGVMRVVQALVVAVLVISVTRWMIAIAGSGAGMFEKIAFVWVVGVLLSLGLVVGYLDLSRQRPQGRDAHGRRPNANLDGP